MGCSHSQKVASTTDELAPDIIGCLLNNYTDEAIFKILDSNNDLISAFDERGKSVLMWAIDLWKLDLAEYLVSKGCDVNTCDQNGWSALMYAAKRGNLHLGKMLLMRDANIFCVTKDEGWNALHIACLHGSVVFASVLLERGIDLESIDASGMSCLTYLKNEKGAEMLMKRKVDLMVLKLPDRVTEKRKSLIEDDNTSTQISSTNLITISKSDSL